MCVSITQSWPADVGSWRMKFLVVAGLPLV